MMVFDYVRNLGDQEHPQVVLTTEFMAALCLCLIIAHLLEENRWVDSWWLFPNQGFVGLIARDYLEDTKTAAICHILQHFFEPPLYMRYIAAFH
uniref:Uncharacterized protein n=1 Tax=Quercus lobata TaxID=97700 RepID=A0A7N2MD27_QUELO